ncbi:Tryptophan synthase alpha chain [Micractinium conductrix]|uniref:Tryptophan synthase alpha chain n=1 Tax=Micractinium conductrix TaxID=554055 RepID=A0A2P6VJ84_9CHLO|nr:Tryptophan synthase alpha chain [Micractinium conductrix]|eukprot:PSC74134.1 Tryptophan synthase alpha chain [Micractinium conductrix]
MLPTLARSALALALALLLALPPALAAAVPLRLHARHLAQLPLPTPIVKLAPCNDAVELTCSGGAAPSICCNKLNFACGTRSDTGGPRCRVCPQLCVFTCDGAHVCGRDAADGCFKCLPKTASTTSTTGSTTSSTTSTGTGTLGSALACSATRPCAAGKVCAGGACRPDPCATTTCGAAQKCTVVVAGTTATAKCETACAPACTGTKVCQKVAGKWKCVKPPAKARRLAQPGQGVRGA